MKYTPVCFLSMLLVSSALTGSSFPSLSVSQLPLTCWHLLGASISHSPGSSHSSLSLCDGIERMIFFLLRLSSWQKLNIGASTGMLQRFCRARNDPRPPHLLFFGVMSYSWREGPSLPRWLCGLSSVSHTDVAQIKVRGQWPTKTMSMCNESSALWSELAGNIHRFYVTT